MADCDLQPHDYSQSSRFFCTVLSCENPPARGRTCSISLHFCSRFLPNIPGEYDLAAQYLGVADTLVHKVNAKYKVAWNHTDYATQHPNPKLDRRVYTNVDYVVSVSESCTEAFRRMYPAFSQKAVTVENCLARELIERKSLLPAAGMYREAGETVLLSRRSVL